jgi:hypothetical protein
MPWSTLGNDYWVSFKDAAESGLAQRGGVPSGAFQPTSEQWMSREDAEQLYVIVPTTPTLVAKTDPQWVQKKDLVAPVAPSCTVGTLSIVRVEDPPPDPETALNFVVTYGVEYNSGMDKYSEPGFFDFEMYDVSSNYYGYRLDPLTTSGGQPVYNATGVVADTTANSVSYLYGGAVSSMSISLLNFKYVIRPFTASNTYYYELRKNNVVIWSSSQVLTNGVSATPLSVTVNIPVSFTLNNGDHLSFVVTAASALPPTPTEQYFTFGVPSGKGISVDRGKQINVFVQTVNGYSPPVNVTVNFNIMFRYSGGTTYTESSSLVIPAGATRSATNYIRNSGSTIFGQKTYRYVGLSITSFSPTGASGSTFIRQETTFQYV